MGRIKTWHAAAERCGDIDLDAVEREQMIRKRDAELADALRDGMLSADEAELACDSAIYRTRMIRRAQRRRASA
jgi:hypothetical protein